MIKRFGPYQTNSGHWFWCEYDTETKKRRSVLVHREKVEQSLGRKLKPDEVVHHKDGNPSNNDISNLEIKGWADHARHHAPQPEIVSYRCAECGKECEKRAATIRENQGRRGCMGPFCGKSCAAKASYQRPNGLLPGQFEHGTMTAYKYRKCRCRPCTDANTAYYRNKKAQSARVAKLA